MMVRTTILRDFTQVMLLRARKPIPKTQKLTGSQKFLGFRFDINTGINIISTLTHVFLKYPIPPKRKLQEEACLLCYG